MQSLLGSRGWCALLAALLLTAGAACDDEVSLGGDGGPDGSTDTDTDADTDADADAGPDAAACVVDPERIYDDIAFLAGEDLAGRQSGTEGNELALQMAEDVVEELGLEPVGDDSSYRTAFGYQRFGLVEVPTVAVDGDALTYGYEATDDYVVFTGSGSANVTAEMVYVGYGITVPPYSTTEYPDCPLPSTGYNDYEGIDATGKIALVVRHGPGDDATVPDTCPNDDLCVAEPCLWNFGYKAANADAHGAAAMIVVNHYAEVSEHVGGTLGEEGAIADFASVFVDRDIIEASVPNLETWTDGIDAASAPDPHATGVNATIDVTTATVDVTTANVIGVIQGTDPDIGDEVVVVGGHVDHLGVDGTDVFYGADDNASGAAVAMELARLASECASPARTVVFALWNGEEDGLLGSVHYVENPLFPLGSTIAAFSTDMVGAGDDTNLVLYGASEPDADSADPADAFHFPWLSAVMAGSAAEMGFEWGVTPGLPTGSSDHYPFAQVGIPAVCAMSGALETHPYYHTPNDTIDTIGLSNLEMSASLMWAGLRPLVEGTEEEYLTSGKAMLQDVVPARIDRNSRLFRGR
jgi:hypothetical protein